MTDPGHDDPLERVVREAMAQAGGVGTDPETRGLLVERVRRGHLRRRQMVASGAAVVVLLVGAAAFSIAAERAQPHPAAAGVGRDHARADLRKSPAAIAAPPGVPCAEVEVGAGPAACAGSFAPGPVFGAAASAGSLKAQAPENRYSSAGAAGPEEVGVGSVVAVTLPSGGDVRWSQPGVAGSTAAGTGSARGQVVLRPVGPGTGTHARAPGGVFEAVRPGTAVVEAVAHDSCPGGTGGTGGTTAGKVCGPVVETWSLTVVVEGR